MIDRIVWFDLETTGVNPTTDRIVEICMIKTDLSGSIIDSFHSLIYPGDGIESRPEAIEKHGISNEMLQGKPLFKDVAKEIYDFIGDSHLGGYNILYFDIPFLVEEFLKANIVFNHRLHAVIDPFLIYTKCEPRDLSTAYKRYTGKSLEGAHRAENDIKATIEIFDAQRKLYELDEDPVKIDKLVNTNRFNTVDLSGKFKFKEIDERREIIFNFGKWKDKQFKEVFEKDRGYIEWIINNKEFPTESRIIAKKLLNKLSKEKEISY